MSQATLATANAILKEDYLGPLRTALNTSTPVLDRIKKNTRDIAGRQAWIPIEMSLNQGAGARAENQVLPTSGQGEYKELKVDLKHYYGSLSVTGPVLRQTAKGEKGSFGRIIDIEAKGMKRLLGLVLAHDFYLGHTLATCGVTAASNTIVLDSASNMEYFKAGMTVDIVDAGTGAITDSADSRLVTDVDKVGKTIDVDGAAVTTAVTDIVVREDTFGNTVTPLEDIISDTADIYGVDTSLFPEWRSTVDSGVGAFTAVKLQTTLDKIVVASGKMPTAIYSDYTLQRKYWEELTANPRYMVAGDAKKTLDGGFRTLEYSGGGAPIPWIADRLAPGGTIYLPHEPDLQVFTPGEFEWIEIGGDVWLPDILGANAKDNFKAVLFRDMEFGAYNRNSHGKMKGVS